MQMTKCAVEYVAEFMESVQDEDNAWRENGRDYMIQVSYPMKLS